jgi:site-specific DNA recombinase
MLICRQKRKEPKMKAIGYTRVSTEGQVVDGVSMSAQAAKIRAWAELSDAAEVAIFTDAGLSGGRADNRPGLQDALAAVGSGDVLVVYSLSRLARSTKDTINIAEALAKRGADLVSLSEKIDTSSASGKMIFRLMAVLSEFERDQVSERTRAALDHKRANGEKCGGRVPYGFDATDDGHLVANSTEQEGLAIMRQLRSDGMSFRRICAEMERRGYQTKTGSQWLPATVKKLCGVNA